MDLARKRLHSEECRHLSSVSNLVVMDLARKQALEVARPETLGFKPCCNGFSSEAHHIHLLKTFPDVSNLVVMDLARKLESVFEDFLFWAFVSNLVVMDLARKLFITLKN